MLKTISIFLESINNNIELYIDEDDIPEEFFDPITGAIVAESDVEISEA